MEKNGFFYALIVAQRLEEPNNDQWEVCDGNHRLKILRDSGVSPIPVHKMGRISKERRMNLGIEMNEWNFDYDAFSLARCVQEIKSDTDWETTPFSGSELGNFEELLNLDKLKVERKNKVKLMRIHKETLDAVKEFVKAQDGSLLDLSEIIYFAFQDYVKLLETEHEDSTS